MEPAIGLAVERCASLNHAAWGGIAEHVLSVMVRFTMQHGHGFS
jgi:hypothetical protein